MSQPKLKARDMLLNQNEYAVLELLFASQALNGSPYLRGLKYRKEQPTPRTEVLCWRLMLLTQRAGYDPWDREGWMAIVGQICVSGGVDYDKAAYCAMNFTRLPDFLLPNEVV